MDNTYFSWEEYSENWRSELISVVEYSEKFEKNEFPVYGLNHLNFVFKSDTKEKLERLSLRLSDDFDCTSLEIVKSSEGFDLKGNTPQFPMTKDNLIFWQLSFYKEGYNFDARLYGYGAYTAREEIEFLDYSAEKEEYYYKKAVEQYKKGNLFGAIVNWNNTLKVNPMDYYSYYDLGYVKNELYMFKDAMRDFEKAIEINPKYYAAIVARGTLSDENEEYELAIEYYDRAIELEPKNPQAYFNKGNSCFNKNELEKACGLWKKAKELGADYAQERINKECRK